MRSAGRSRTAAATTEDDAPRRPRIAANAPDGSASAGITSCRTTPGTSSPRSRMTRSAGTSTRGPAAPGFAGGSRTGFENRPGEPVRCAHVGVREPGHDLASHDAPVICPPPLGGVPGRLPPSRSRSGDNSDCQGRNMVSWLVRSVSPSLFSLPGRRIRQKSRKAVGHGHRNKEPPRCRSTPAPRT
jgi:hypothetical protein